MKIYLLTQSENNDYDTYDSMVIAAENEEDAKHLSFVKCYAYSNCIGSNYTHELIWRDYYLDTSSWAFGSWSKTPTVELIVENALAVKEGVICASFNAG